MRLHRGLAFFFAALAIPAVLWWKESILFVILLSLATQVSTEWGAAEAANDQAVTARLRHVEAQLEALLERKRDDRPGTSPAQPAGPAVSTAGPNHPEHRKRPL